MELTPQQFYLDTALYTPIKVQEFNEIHNYTNPYEVDPFSGYNPVDKIDTTFFIREGYRYTTGAEFIRIILRCKRTDLDIYFALRFDEDTMTFMKIGQYPSIADFHISQVKQYDKLLGKDKLKEFTRAIGLAANGVGIGSFVYLRRIFEDLIFDAYDEHKEKEGEIIGFTQLNMKDKIESLKHNLPIFLVENKSIYSILSKGIHELKEVECLTYFNAVKDGIELILDEKLQQAKALKKMEDAKLRLQQITDKLNKPPVK